MKQQNDVSRLIEELAEVRSENCRFKRLRDKKFKRLLKESQTAEDRWRNLIKGFPDRVLIVDRKGPLIFLNRTGPTRTIKEVLGTNIMDHLPEKSGAHQRSPGKGHSYRNEFGISGPY